MDKSHSSVPGVNIEWENEEMRVVRLSAGKGISVHDGNLRADGSITMIDLVNQKVVAFAHKIEMNSEVEGLNAYVSRPVAFSAKTSTGIGELIFENVTVDEEPVLIGEVIHNGEHFVLVSIDYQDDVFGDWIEIPVGHTPKLGLAQIVVSTPSNSLTKVNIVIIAPDSKGLFMFHVIDSDFMNRYGGILHGMSGSPIVQDGRLVGAVSAGVPVLRSIGIMTPINKVPK